MNDTIDRPAVGPELDEALALALGWVRVHDDPTWWQRPADEFGSASPPRYSTDLLAAWRLVERWRAQGYGILICCDGATDNLWEIELAVDSPGDYDRGMRGLFGGGCTTLPEAIARTALGHAEMLAKGSES